MTGPSPDWLAEQQAAEHAFLARFAQLDAVLVRVDGYVRRAEDTAAALARLPNGDPAARLQEAADLRQVARIASHHLANLDRVHLLEEPRPARRKAGQRGASR